MRPADLFSGVEGFRFMAVSAGATAFLGGFAYLRRPRKIWDLPQDKFLLGLWASIGLSLATRGDHEAAFAGTVAFLTIVFYYFLIRFAVREPRHFRAFVSLLVVLNLAIALNAIVRFHSGLQIPASAPGADGRAIGVGIFGDPNDLGLALLMVVPFLLTDVLMRGGTRIRRVYSLAVLAVLLVAIYYTRSRGAWIGLATLLVAYSALRLGAVSGVIAAALLAVCVVSFGPSRIAEIDIYDTSALGRVSAWSAALEMLSSSPLCGVGFGRFMDFHERVAHNSFAHLFAEVGLLGAFCFTGMVYWTLKSAWLVHRETRTRPEVRSAVGDRAGDLLASAIGLLAAGSFLSQQYGPVLYTLMSLGACHMAIARELGACRERTRSWRDPLGIGLLVGVGIALIYAIVRIFGM